MRNLPLTFISWPGGIIMILSRSYDDINDLRPNYGKPMMTSMLISERRDYDVVKNL